MANRSATEQSGARVALRSPGRRDRTSTRPNCSRINAFAGLRGACLARHARPCLRQVRAMPSGRVRRHQQACPMLTMEETVCSNPHHGLKGLEDFSHAWVSLRCGPRQPCACMHTHKACRYPCHCDAASGEVGDDACRNLPCSSSFCLMATERATRPGPTFTHPAY